MLYATSTSIKEMFLGKLCTLYAKLLEKVSLQ